MNQLSLFNEPQKEKIVCKTMKSTEYADFLKKFEAKKTTDDCFTPPAVYDAVVSYVVEKYLGGKECDIIRPFFPGGDYENTEYPAGCVVIDNPPFSIMTKICRFYQKNNIPFFLFANHLTLFYLNVIDGLQFVVCDALIKYDNGAKVKSSFITNMHHDKTKVIVLA